MTKLKLLTAIQLARHNRHYQREQARKSERRQRWLFAALMFAIVFAWRISC